jgi:Ca-activated chloride channel family protein
MALRIPQLALLLAFIAPPQFPQGPYTLTTGVDEVSVTFQVADPHGLPIDDLTLADLRILDNNKPPREIVSFDLYRNLPLRAGILIDISPSMDGLLKPNAATAAEFASHLLHGPQDRAFLMRFDSDAKVVQDWTLDPTLLTAGITHMIDYRASRLGGTVLFDSVYRACRDQFATLRGAPTGNFILLFTDGADNASHALLEDDVRICQRAHTAIYAFTSGSGLAFSHAPKSLVELTAQTGGQLFLNHTEQSLWTDLLLIEADLRSQYRIVYKPGLLKSDGSFHRIRLDSPTRGGILTTPSGYYAPGQSPR